MSIEFSRYEDSKPILLAGLDRHYTFQSLDKIPEQWARFGTHMGKLRGQMGGVAYGVSHHMSKDGFRYMSATQVADDAGLPEELTTLALPAQRYAVFAHYGHLSVLCESIDHIWHTWLPKSGRHVTDPPVLIERYGETFDPVLGQGDLELWLAIRQPEQEVKDYS